MRTTAEICDDYIEKFTELVKDLWVMSETDAEMTPLVWKISGKLHDSLLVIKAKVPRGSEIEKCSVQDFFKNRVKEQEWHTPEEKADAGRFAELLKSLQSTLSDLMVYKIGEAKKQVFIVGKLNDKFYAGLSTYVVET